MGAAPTAADRVAASITATTRRAVSTRYGIGQPDTRRSASSLWKTEGAGGGNASRVRLPSPVTRFSGPGKASSARSECRPDRALGPAGSAVTSLIIEAVLPTTWNLGNATAARSEIVT